MFSRRDLAWLASSIYGLRREGDAISGRLHFDMVYDPGNDTYTLWPEPKQLLQPGVIHHADDYDIRISWEPQDAKWPICREVSSKITETARANQLPILELHISHGDQFCLAAPQAMRRAFSGRFSLKRYIENFVIPFLFQQTHFRKHRGWAWPPAGHYSSGIFGWYHQHGHEEDALQLTIMSLATQLSMKPLEVAKWVRDTAYTSDMPCRCQSGKAVAACCPEALWGYNRLRLKLGGIIRPRS
jgi:hypothetical protein